MKKRFRFFIAAAVGALLLLFSLTVYLTLTNLDTLFESGPTAAQTNADTAIAALHEAESPSALSTELTSSNADEPPLIWAGDSRTLGMQNAMDNADIYIGAAGEGYQWLIEYGLPIIKEAISDNPQSPVIFNFGVNDYDNLDFYLACYETLTTDYPNTVFYFLSVNPIDPMLCQNITNEEIADFNAHLKAAFPDTYLDSYTYLMVNEIATNDGIHYSEEGYRQIYEYTAQQISLF